MTATSTLATLLSISLNHDLSIAVIINPIAVIIILGIVIVGIVLWRKYLASKFAPFEIDEASIGTGTGTITFRPNLRDQEIAYKIWVELSTRKIGLQIDLDHDVIEEIYDSWHSFFSITRELIKDIPVSKVKGESTREIIRLSISVLNEGLRPHLTRWQARFRHWYEKKLKSEGDDIDPQAIQASYPEFAELKKDLLAVNERLIRYREKMREIVLGAALEAPGAELEGTPEKPTL